MSEIKSFYSILFYSITVILQLMYYGRPILDRGNEEVSSLPKAEAAPCKITVSAGF